MRKVDSFYFVSIVSLSLSLIAMTACDGRHERSSRNKVDSEQLAGQEMKANTMVKEAEPLFTYNFYIENSGSVKGYFKGKSNDAGVIIKEFYDRIDERLREGEQITLNYINNKIKPQSCDINTWLNNTYANCNELYSDIDKVLEQALDNTDEQTVNFVVSDYCFESKDGDLRRAQSGITKMFTKALAGNRDLSVAIYKYETSFDGYYYPGRVKYTGKRPLYVWAFGPSRAIKKVSNLRIQQQPEGEVYFQYPQSYSASVETNHARMTDATHSCIRVKEWEQERREPGVYKAKLKVTLDNLILSSFAVMDFGCYELSPSEYYLDRIEKQDGEEYIYTIATKHPSPAQLVVCYKTELPEWVEMSNYDQSSQPDHSATYGIKYLINGVANAYKNQSENLFDFRINLK